MIGKNYRNGYEAVKVKKPHQRRTRIKAAFRARLKKLFAGCPVSPYIDFKEIYGFRFKPAYGQRVQSEN